MKVVVNKLNRIIEEETALALRFLRFQQQIDELEKHIAMKITQRKLKQIIKEEVQRTLLEVNPGSTPVNVWRPSVSSLAMEKEVESSKEGYYGAPRLISPDIEGAFEQAKAACKQGVLATMEGNELSFSCVEQKI